MGKLTRLTILMFVPVAWAQTHYIALAATASSGATSYSVYRGTHTGGPYSQIASGLGSPAYNDVTYTPGINEYYVMTASNAGGESGYSNESEAMDPSPPSGGGSSTGGGGTSYLSVCGPPNYCARTDLAVQQKSPLPLTLDSTGTMLNLPAGSAFIDPDFGSIVERITDNNTLQGAGCFNSTTQNTSLEGSDNPDLAVWSSDDKWFRVEDLNGHAWLYSFNPSTLTAACVPWTAFSLHALAWPTIFQRQPANAGIAIGDTPRTGNWWVLQSLNVTNTSNTLQTYYDFSTCTGLSWVSSVPERAADYFPGMWNSYDDHRIMWSFGPTQNQGWLSAIYDSTVGDCGWIDTRTGQVGGNAAITTSGTTTGAFPLDWGSTRAASIPTCAATHSASGTLTPGHTYDCSYSLQLDSNVTGTGESSASTPQRIPLPSGATACSGSTCNAISTPSPQQCSTQPNCDIAIWTYYNVYANDEANCSGAQCPASSLYLQPAANLGLTNCTLTAPAFTSSNITQNGTSGGTDYAYAEVAYSTHCNVWTQAFTAAGNATLSGSNYNIVTPAAVTGATFYNIAAGPAGSTTVWPSTVYGTSSVDAASPSGGGTALYPGSITIQASTAARDDQPGNALNLFSMGTVPCYDGMTFPPPGLGLTSGSAIFNCNNNSTLTAISTSGPTAPTKSTLGIFMHAAVMDRTGHNVVWGQESANGNNVLWQLGSNTTTMCSATASIEYPSNNFYPVCFGHSLTQAQGIVQFNPLTSPSTDPNYSQNYRTFSNYVTQYGQPGAAAPLFGISAYPALDPNGSDAIDTHSSANGNYGSDATTLNTVSSEGGPANTAFQYPGYIGRGWMEEVYGWNPNGNVYRFAHNRVNSGFPYQTTTPCMSLSGGCETITNVGETTVSDDNKFGLMSTSMDNSLGCDPTLTFPISSVTAANPTTMTITIPAGNSAPLSNQIGTIFGSTGVTGLNAQWTITGTSPNFTLSGSNLTGTATLTNAFFAECTFNGSGQVNGPAAAATCGSGAQSCKTGKGRSDVFVIQLR